MSVNLKAIENEDNVVILDTDIVLHRDRKNSKGAETVNTNAREENILFLSFFVAASKPGFVRASFQCRMSTSATFIFRWKPTVHITGVFHHASQNRFYILENCGPNCHFLFRQDTSKWKDNSHDELLAAPGDVHNEIPRSNDLAAGFGATEKKALVRPTPKKNRY